MEMSKQKNELSKVDRLNSKSASALNEGHELAWQQQSLAYRRVET